jgi:D-alanyl-lipoteichoic acid acyltransferase DltB (MBOAT superfamily)
MSLIYYACWDVKYLAVIIGSVLINFWFGKRIQASSSQVVKRLFTIGGICTNVAALGYFKYTDFLLRLINECSGAKIPLPGIVLPIGISFFTFQQIAFLVDCYKGMVQERNFLSYCLFICFFPQLVAGPIVHHNEMTPQFADLSIRRFDHLNCYRGITLLFFGLAKKAVLADGLAPIVVNVFDKHPDAGFMAAWAGSLAYTFQLYFDFSGYSDMAVGIGLLFNVHLPQNFLSPYTALNVQDFWRRWHVTLSRWLMTYIYIPLGGNHAGFARTLINLFLTFLIGGIWHGAGETFVLWGVMHGVALVLHRIWKTNRGEKTPSSKTAFFRWLATFLFVNAAWVMFRAKTVACAMTMYKCMLGIEGKASLLAIAEAMWKKVFYGMGGVSNLMNLDIGWHEIKTHITIFPLVLLGFWKLYDTSRYRTAMNPHWICTGFVLSLSLVSYWMIGRASRPPEFLYFQF